MGSHSLLQGISQPKDRTQVSHITGNSLPAEPPEVTRNTISIRPVPGPELLKPLDFLRDDSTKGSFYHVSEVTGKASIEP